ncbi:MAG TPA: hypothetical protein VGR53_06675, partial [Nitrososphaerales archaeon]|nr:hypothetical protein [Nitrososphaerales archaeon]
RFYVVYASGDSNFKMPLLPVDSYAHRYIKGEVVCLCVFGENLISRDPEAQFFLVYATIYGSGMLPVPGCSSHFTGYCWHIGPRAAGIRTSLLSLRNT